MKGVILLSMTIVFALCMIDRCKGWPRFPKPRKPTYPGPIYPGPGPTYPRPTWRRSATINTEHNRTTINDDIEDEDIEKGERHVDMNDEVVIKEIDEQYVNDPEADD